MSIQFACIKPEREESEKVYGADENHGRERQ
jgi:hypothetical protein